MDFINLIIEEGKKAGLSDIEVFYSKENGSNLDYVNSELEKYSQEESQGAMIKGFYNGNTGFSYTANFDEEAIIKSIESIKENSAFIESTEKEIIYSGSDNYEKVINEESEIAGEDINYIMKFVDEAISYGKSLDKRITKINVYLQRNKNLISIKNTRGLDLEKSSDLIYMVYSAVAEDKGEVQDSYKIILLKEKSFETYKENIKEVVESALNKLGAASIPSGKMKAVFSKNTLRDLLGYVLGHVSAKEVVEHVSKLEGQIGNKIMSEAITIIEDPLSEKGYQKVAFDDEGVATKKKAIIEKGVLKTYLTDLKNAKILNMEPTGNAFKNSYKNASYITATTVYMEKGTLTEEELLKKCDNGIYISEVSGLHAGMSGINGDFSLISQGFLIENGKKTRAVNQITIAGNIFDILKEAEDFGSEIEFDFGFGYLGVPEMLVKEISVSGK